MEYISYFPVRRFVLMELIFFLCQTVCDNNASLFPKTRWKLLCILPHVMDHPYYTSYISALYRVCIYSSLQGVLGWTSFHSFRVHGPRLFNSLPIQMRNLTRCTVEEYITQLDKVLSMVPDEPRACDQFTGKPSDSLIDQIRSIHFQKRRKEGR